MASYRNDLSNFKTRPNDQLLTMPQFIIPKLPDLTPVPLPKPVKRLPPVGYDMRTLRKQMDQLYLVLYPLFLGDSTLRL